MEKLLSQSQSFQCAAITSADISRAIRSLSSISSYGDNNVSAIMLHISLQVISPCLVQIFTASLFDGIFSDIWKSAVVAPVLKKGNICDVTNYRPIFLLSLFGKLFEKIVCRQLTEYLEYNFLLYQQHGFCRKRSYETALLRLSNILFTAKHQKLNSVLATIDLTKTFDCIPFEQLTTSLAFVGINGTALDWFTSYLTGRSQCVKYFNVLSTPLPIQFGVPQDSIRGTCIVQFVHQYTAASTAARFLHRLRR